METGDTGLGICLCPEAVEMGSGLLLCASDWIGGEFDVLLLLSLHELNSMSSCCSSFRELLSRYCGTEVVLKRINYPHAMAHPRCKVSYQGVPNRLALSLRLCFIEASLTAEKAVSCYKLIASLLSFRSLRSSFAVRKFHAAGEEHRERGHGRVCANL